MRIGLVRYLNARPLDYGLRSTVRVPTNNPPLQAASDERESKLTGQDTSTELELIEEIPSRLFQMLRDRELDAALISSVECLRNPDLFGYCSTVGVCARREAYSIVYIRRRSPDPAAGVAALDSRNFVTPVRRILADTGSRSSIALLQSLYFRANGVLPIIETRAPETIAEQVGPEDGGLLIGDGALQFLDQLRESSEPEFEILDLAQWWSESEGLPFVFALWAYPRNRPVADHIFEASLAAGEQNMDRIVAEARRSDAEHYLTKNLHYRLGTAERSALQRFHQRLTEADLLFSDHI